MKKAPKFKRGKAGTIEKSSKRGRLPGVSSTPKEAAAARTAALVHGGAAKLVTRAEAAATRLEKKIPGARKVLDAYREALTEGELGAVDEIAAGGMADLEIIRRDLVGSVKRQGAIIRETVFGSDGEPVAERLKVHPGVDPAIRISESLGFTSTARKLDPKSRGEGDRDAAIVKALERDKMLRSLSSADKSKMAPPPEDDPIDAEIVSRPI